MIEKYGSGESRLVMKRCAWNLKNCIYLNGNFPSHVRQHLLDKYPKKKVNIQCK